MVNSNGVTNMKKLIVILAIANFALPLPALAGSAQSPTAGTEQATAGHASKHHRAARHHRDKHGQEMEVAPAEKSKATGKTPPAPLANGPRATV